MLYDKEEQFRGVKRKRLHLFGGDAFLRKQRVRSAVSAIQVLLLPVLVSLTHTVTPSTAPFGPHDSRHRLFLTTNPISTYTHVRLTGRHNHSATASRSTGAQSVMSNNKTASVSHFRNLVEEETRKLNSLCTEWEKVLAQSKCESFDRETGPHVVPFSCSNTGSAGREQ